MIDTNLKRFWFEFERNNAFDLPAGLGIGCGITALNYEDALEIIDEKIFRNNKRPPVKNAVENIDISDLDQGHVIPNMKAPISRGIWFPLGYD